MPNQTLGEGKVTKTGVVLYDYINELKSQIKSLEESRKYFAEKMGEALAEKDIRIHDLEERNNSLRIRTESQADQIQDQEEEIQRLNNIIDLDSNLGDPAKDQAFKKDTRTEAQKRKEDPGKIKLSPKDKRILKIQCMEKKKVRDRKVQERRDGWPK